VSGTEPGGDCLGEFEVWMHTGRRRSSEELRRANARCGSTEEVSVEHVCCASNEGSLLITYLYYLLKHVCM